ncbi:hypothetical protein KKH27_01835 [bacterium]|nr:hypothetical protein [bacterium]MBU1982840.1 hypothetical protein [bacterium]
MITYSRALDCDLLAFWYEHARPGRIGLISIDVITARLIGWAERNLTPNREPSPWAHAFIFLRPRSGVPWIAESDMQVPLPGFRPKPNGPQENLIYKWSHPAVDRAVVLDPGLTEQQLLDVQRAITLYLDGGFRYSVSELAETWIALERGDPMFRGPLHRDDSMHCGHFIRSCLQSAGNDPLRSELLPENTVPEHLAQAFPVAAEWRRI